VKAKNQKRIENHKKAAIHLKAAKSTVEIHAQVSLTNKAQKEDANHQTA
jgi:hypothetical protein